MLFPKKCAVCEKDGVFVCDDCLSEIALYCGFYCPFCKKRIPSSDSPKCSDYCFKHYKIKSVFSLAEYSSPPVKELLHWLKFGGAKEVGAIFGGIMADKLEKSGILNEKFVIIPVPLRKKNLRRRGFNQSEIVAKKISEKLRVPLLTDSLVKKINTKHQTETKSREERMKNLAGAFEILRPERISGKNILLVDDIITTGATLSECAKELKRAGAKKIYGVTVAR